MFTLKFLHAERGRLEQPCGYFYMQMPPPMPSPQRDFGWDFFNPFDTVRPEVISGYQRSSDDDLRVVREEEGIPELEEEGVHREEQETKVVVADRKSTRLNSSHNVASRMPSSA